MPPSPFLFLTAPHAVTVVASFKPILRLAILREWPGLQSNVVILTGERRYHYLSRHPEALRAEPHLSEMINLPDEVFRNRHDRSIAIFYKYLEGRYWMRAAVWISESKTLRNSVFSLRFAAEEEVARDREQRLLVWKNG